MRSRLLVAVPGIALAVVVVLAGGLAFALVLAAIAVLGLMELYSLTAALRPLRWAGYLGVLATILLAWGVTPRERGVLLGLGLSLGFAGVAGLVPERIDDVTVRMAVTLLGSVYLGLPMAVLVLMRERTHGAGAVANILVGTWAFDTFSFMGGRLFGRTPIAPRVSPKKTLEGFVVGLMGGTLAVWLAGVYMSWIDGFQSALLGVVICLAAFAGDLVESLLKRDARVKDSGHLLLGHGGVLDRFDALLFSAIAGYFTTSWLVS